MPDNVPTKELEDIVIHVSRQETDGKQIKETCKLSKILKEYLLKLGYTNMHIFNVIVSLLTDGKIWVQFRSYAERFELEDYKDRLPRAQAIEKLEAYIEKNREPDAKPNVTQRIVIQPSKS